MSPALAGRFLTTAPPGKSHSYILKESNNNIEGDKKITLAAALEKSDDVCEESILKAIEVNQTKNDGGFPHSHQHSDNSCMYQ